jgi:hypothetical protein
MAENYRLLVFASQERVTISRVELPEVLRGGTCRSVLIKPAAPKMGVGSCGLSVMRRGNGLER